MPIYGLISMNINGGTGNYITALDASGPPPPLSLNVIRVVNSLFSSHIDISSTPRSTLCF
jgi:hypothetical protein